MTRKDNITTIFTTIAFGIFCIFLFFTAFGCTDEVWNKYKALDNPAHIECYSGGTLIYKGQSTGKVAYKPSSDGYYFIDVKDNKPKEISGNCVITYSNEPGSNSVK